MPAYNFWVGTDAMISTLNTGLLYGLLFVPPSGINLQFAILSLEKICSPQNKFKLTITLNWEKFVDFTPYIDGHSSYKTQKLFLSILQFIDNFANNTFVYLLVHMHYMQFYYELRFHPHLAVALVRCFDS